MDDEIDYDDSYNHPEDAKEDYNVFEEEQVFQDHEDRED